MKIKLIIACLLFFSCRVYGQEGSALDNPVISKLKTFLTTHTTEKTYLQFDKPFYAAGDTIYFKTYVTLGERHKLSNLSSVLHVDLINTNNKIDQSIKLQLVNGVAWGDFLLPDSLPKGNYRIRAYTQWMRNGGDAAFFERIMPVGSAEKEKIAESMPAGIKANAKPDLQFFPEGGSLVDGIRSKIAFKAIGASSKGIDVAGVILDNNNTEVCRFASTHLGMGNFYLQPQEGKSYTAKLTFADGSQAVVKLPGAEATGLVLTVNNDSLPKVSVRIEASKVCFAQNRDKDYMLLIYSGGIATSVTCKLDSSVILLDIAKRRLHTGVATVTLFSPDGEPISERLFFVQNYDQLKLDVKTDKTAYVAKGKVSIILNAKNRADSAVMGHFSVSVIDEGKVPINENEENSILANLLLTSDLKGEVEQPNYYFTNDKDEARNNLDLVMLTHGYRRFAWTPLLNNTYPPVAYQPEKSLEIAGTARMLGGRALSKGTISLIAPFSGHGVLSTVTDDKGNFRFTNMVYMDTAKFILQAVNVKGSSNTVLTYNGDNIAPLASHVQPRTISEDTVTNAYLKNNQKQRNQLYAQGLIGGKMLKEVKINARKIDNNYRTQSLAGAGHADQVLHSKDIGYGMLRDNLNGKLRGVVFVGPTPYLELSFMDHLGSKAKGMLVIVDGIEGAPLPISADEVETVEVLKYASASIYGMNAAGGVLVITTKIQQGKELKDIYSKGILPITARGFYKAREFYSPKYETAATNKFADLRTTIYWNPEMVTDKNGNAEFEFYNADATGSYRVVVEGIDEKGNLGRQVYRYKVK